MKKLAILALVLGVISSPAFAHGGGGGGGGGGGAGGGGGGGDGGGGGASGAGGGGDGGPSWNVYKCWSMTWCRPVPKKHHH